MSYNSRVNARRNKKRPKSDNAKRDAFRHREAKRSDEIRYSGA